MLIAFSQPCSANLFNNNKNNNKLISIKMYRFSKIIKSKSDDAMCKLLKKCPPHVYVHALEKKNENGTQSKVSVRGGVPLYGWRTPPILVRHSQRTTG